MSWAFCREFQQAFSDLIADNETQAGHDFWLNRNGHGSGFWDGDWSEPAATILDQASHGFGEVYDEVFATDGLTEAD